MCDTNKKLYLYYDDFSGKLDPHYIKYISDTEISAHHREGSHLLPLCVEFEHKEIPGFANIWTKVKK